MKKNVVLVGFMGSGKSTLAQILGQRFGWEVVSTDQWIERKEGRLIAEIFQQSGEAYFRQREHQVVLEVSHLHSVIIDCGGGVVINPLNVAALKSTGFMVYLNCDPQEILRRVKRQPKRPLLDVPDPLAKIEQLIEERKSYYAQADFTIDTTDGDLMRVADVIIQRISND